MNDDPNVLTRFGRVLHWLATMGAILLFVSIGFSTHYYLTNDYYVLEGGGESAALQMGSITAGVAAVVYLFGRGLRYIFSGE